MSFGEDVLELVSQIPRGSVTTYSEIARVLGKPRAYRAVGNALAKNPNPEKIPCHRVIRSDGLVGGYVRGKEKKEKLLEDEGIEINDGKVDLGEYLFDDF